MSTASLSPVVLPSQPGLQIRFFICIFYQTVVFDCIGQHRSVYSFVGNEKLGIRSGKLELALVQNKQLFTSLTEFKSSDVYSNHCISSVCIIVCVCVWFIWQGKGCCEVTNHYKSKEGFLIRMISVRLRCLFEQLRLKIYRFTSSIQSVCICSDYI